MTEHGKKNIGKRYGRVLHIESDSSSGGAAGPQGTLVIGRRMCL